MGGRAVSVLVTCSFFELACTRPLARADQDEDIPPTASICGSPLFVLRQLL